jgi:TolB-like protein
MLMTRRYVLAVGLVACSAMAGEGLPVVDVLYFNVNSTEPELEVFRKGLAQMLVTDLAAAGVATVVERDRLEDVLAELKLGQDKRFDQAKAAQVGKLLGSQYHVLGSITGNKFTKVLAIEVKIVDSETGQIVAKSSKRVFAKVEDIFPAEQELAAALVTFVSQLSAKAPIERPKTGGRLSLDGAVKFGRALDAKDKKDKAKAKALLTELVTEQPQFALGKAELLALSE